MNSYMNVRLREATHHEIPAMSEIASQGSNESKFVGTFSLANCVDYLTTFVEWEDATVMLAVDDDIVLGGVILVKSREVWEQPLCYLVKFWISKAGRRTPASSRIMRFIDAWAERNKCLAVYATATGELSDREQRLFENMMKKSGYSDVGPTLKTRIT